MGWIINLRPFVICLNVPSFIEKTLSGPNMLQVELILRQNPMFPFHITCYLWNSGPLFLVVWAERIEDTWILSHSTVRVPLLWRSRRIKSDHCVEILRSQKHCIFSSFGFLKSSPHSSHCTAKRQIQHICQHVLKCSFEKHEHGVLKSFMPVCDKEGQLFFNGCLTFGCWDTQL